jgi:capsular polysaccharide biosynthesis protein
LPNLVELLNEKKINEKSIIVTTHIHESCLDALKIVLGINYVPIIQLNLFNKINLKKIIMSKSSAHAVEKIDGKTPVYKFKKRNIKLLRNTFKKYWDPFLEIKIFVVRDSKYRKLTNQDELVMIARKNGYHVLNPEKLTLLEQIKIFSNARNIVGQSGAWLSNLIFVKNDSKVTVLLPKIEADSPPSMWRMLAKLWDFEVTDIYCPITNINNYQPIHSDFKLDPELFINILKK